MTEVGIYLKDLQGEMLPEGEDAAFLEFFHLFYRFPPTLSATFDFKKLFECSSPKNSPRRVGAAAAPTAVATPQRKSSSSPCHFSFIVSLANMFHKIRIEFDQDQFQ